MHGIEFSSLEVMKRISIIITDPVANRAPGIFKLDASVGQVSKYSPEWNATLLSTPPMH